jgi:cellulose synthase/poly-beta-1,6-N-acetylglucosamine synthase-like glycosyltransferase
LILDALTWLSLVLILCLSIYSIRSAIFIKVTGIRENNTSHKMRKVDAIPQSTGCKVVPLYKHEIIADAQKDIDSVNRAYGEQIIEEYPFISIFVATHNESLVIDRLLDSFIALSYPNDRFEVIIVDDSTDDTYQKIQSRLPDLQNLKVVHRENRAGWKGGALNIALDVMDKRTSNVLVLDADSILLSDTVERFVSTFIKEQYFYKEKGISVLAIQGFPISKSYLEAGDEWVINGELSNWVSRAIDFRLSQRNMIEFAAKDLLDLPVQITGSLFMIRADIIKSIKFSTDLCEDWELTLDVYCCSSRLPLSSSIDLMMTSNNTTQSISNPPSRKKIFSNNDVVSSKPRIIFSQGLVSFCEASTDLVIYFRQRMRVSEGHTRGLRRRVRHITESKMLSYTEKVELFLNGLQYAKFIFVLGIGILDIFLILMFLLGSYNNNHQLMNLFEISLSLQAANLATSIALIIWAAKICKPVRRYDIKDVLSLLALYVITTPAFVIGSLRGLLRNKGTFYKTRRNLPKGSKLNTTSVPFGSTKMSRSYTGS